MSHDLSYLTLDASQEMQVTIRNQDASHMKQVTGRKYHDASQCNSHDASHTTPAVTRLKPRYTTHDASYTT